MTGQSVKTQHSRNCFLSKHCTPCASWITTALFPAATPQTNGRSSWMARRNQNNAGSCPLAANGPAPIQANWFAGKKMSRNVCSIWNVKKNQIDSIHHLSFRRSKVTEKSCFTRQPTGYHRKDRLKLIPSFDNKEVFKMPTPIRYIILWSFWFPNT